MPSVPNKGVAGRVKRCMLPSANPPNPLPEIVAGSEVTTGAEDPLESGTAALWIPAGDAIMISILHTQHTHAWRITFSVILQSY
jgi:hypothetical protein